MKLWAIVFFLLPLIGCAYVGWHVWRLLPLTAFWKTVSVVMLLACFVLFVMNFVIGLDPYADAAGKNNVRCGELVGYHTPLSRHALFPARCCPTLTSPPCIIPQGQHVGYALYFRFHGGAFLLCQHPLSSQGARADRNRLAWEGETSEETGDDERSAPGLS